MNKAIDSMIYQWALTDEDKAMPTVFEDIAEMGVEDKVSSLLEVFAHLVSNVIESELSYITVVEQYTAKAVQEADLDNEEMDDIVEAIDDLEDVKELKEAGDMAAKMLDVFQRSFVRSIASGE